MKFLLQTLRRSLQLVSIIEQVFAGTTVGTSACRCLDKNDVSFLRRVSHGNIVIAAHCVIGDTART